MLLVAEEYSVVYMYHIFLIYSSADGHLNWFHNYKQYNTTHEGAGVLNAVFISSGYTSSSGTVGWYIVLYLVCREVSMLFSMVAVLFYSPPTV